MTLAANIAFAALAVSALLCLGRLLRGPSLADRIVALDALLIVVVTGVAIYIGRSKDTLYLDVILLTSLLGFVATVSVARFMEHRRT